MISLQTQDIPREDRDDYIRRRYESGATRNEIAAELGCSGSRVGQIMKQLGLPGRTFRDLVAGETPGEEWRDVAGWPYQVSSLGRARRTRLYINSNRDGVVALVRCSGGYPGFTLKDGDRKQTALVHDLVAKAFLGPRPSPRHLVAHFDGSRNNNRLENLRWATFEENEGDKRRHGTAPVGVQNPQAKCNNQIVRDIRASSESLGVLGKRYGISKATASKIRRGNSWAHVT